MGLPEKVKAGADRAAELMLAANKGQPQAPAPAKGTPVDAAKLQADLATALENARQADTRYAVLQGKYNREVPDLQAKLKASNERVTELEALMKRKIESGEITSLSDDERRLMGEDMVKGTAKIAAEVTDARINASVAPLRKELDESRERQENAYYATLDEQFPEWEVQNKDPKFVAWLREVDPTSQRLRMDLVRRAEAGFNALRVAEVFRAFKEGREIGLPKAADPLERREEPGQNAAGGDVTVDANGKKVWTRGMIAQFFRDKREGKYRGKEDEAHTIETDIFAAQRDGRVRA